MVTGRGCFPVGERGHRWLPESRPCGPLVRHSYVYRAAAALPFTAQAQESVRRVAVLGTSLNSFSLVRVGQSSGWPISLDKIVNPPEGDNVEA